MERFLIPIIFTSIYLIYRVFKWLSETSGRGRSRRPYYPPYQTPPEESSQVESPPRTSRWRSSEHEVTVTVCTNCGKWNNPAKEGCWSCSKPLAAAPQHTQKIETSRRCAVCKAEIFSKERIVICPGCQAQGHHSEFLEFVKVKLECPECGQRLRPSHLLDAEPLG